MNAAMLTGRVALQAAARRSTTALFSRAMSTHVSVIGLHWKTDEIRLRQAFEQYGKLEESLLITPAHSSTHLWARLVYSSFDEALDAVTEMNGQELDGRLLRVSIVDPLKEGESPRPPPRKRKVVEAEEEKEEEEE